MVKKRSYIELFIHTITHKITSTSISNFSFYSSFYPNLDMCLIHFIKVFALSINIRNFDTTIFWNIFLISYLNFSYFQFRKSRYDNSPQFMVYNVNSLYKKMSCGCRKPCIALRLNVINIVVTFILLLTTLSKIFSLTSPKIFLCVTKWYVKSKVFMHVHLQYMWPI